LPADKYNWIESKKKDKTAFVGYVGDGINDAPSLMLADVGISMGINGNSASIEASNIVLVDDNPQKVGRAIKISKFTRKIVWENIIFAAVVKLVFLTLGAVGVTGMLSAVIADVGVTLLAILNSIRALRYHPNGKQK
jgi:Cd2+/Zn2+-exporting ATPase